MYKTSHILNDIIKYAGKLVHNVLDYDSVLFVCIDKISQRSSFRTDLQSISVLSYRLMTAKWIMKFRNKHYLIIAAIKYSIQFVTFTKKNNYVLHKYYIVVSCIELMYSIF